MGQIVLTGALTGGPPSAAANSVPSATVNISLFFAGGARQFQSASGDLQRTINSPSSYVALGAIGPNSDVPKADFLYLHAAGPLDVRITADDGAGGSTVQVISCSGGPLMIPARADKLITLVEVKGSSQIEYFASGPQ